MAVSVVCPGCSKTYQLPESHIGKRARCKKCATEFIAGIAGPPSPPGPPESALVSPSSLGSEGARPSREPLPAAQPDERRSTINVECPSCRRSYDLDSALAGKRARCKGCAEVFRVPAPGESPPAGLLPQALQPKIKDALIDDELEEYSFSPLEVMPSVARRVTANSAARTQPVGVKAVDRTAQRRIVLICLVSIGVGLPSFWISWWFVQRMLYPRAHVPEVAVGIEASHTPEPSSASEDARRSIVLEHREALNQLIETHDGIVSELAGVQAGASRESVLLAIKVLEEKRDALSRHYATLTPLSPVEESVILKEFAPRLLRVLERERDQLKRIDAFVFDRQAVEAEIRHINQAIAELHLAYRGDASSS